MFDNRKLTTCDLSTGPITGSLRVILSNFPDLPLAIIIFRDPAFEGEEVLRLGFQINEGGGGLVGTVFGFGRYPTTTIHIMDGKGYKG